MRKPIFIILILLVFELSNAQNVDQVFQLHLTTIKKYLTMKIGESMSGQELDTSVNFLENITEIKSEYSSSEEPCAQPTKKNLKKWEIWYNKNKQKLYWDEKEKRVEFKMDINKVRKNKSYLKYCKEIYSLKGPISPSSPESQKTNEYQKLVQVAKLYFENNLQLEFSNYLMEPLYLAELWTAHLIIDYGNPDEKLLNDCLNLIEAYTTSSFIKELGIQEKKWLENYRSK